jgi:hypothetical protein
MSPRTDSLYEASGRGSGPALLPMLLVGGCVALLAAIPYVYATRALSGLAEARITGFGSFLGWGLLIGLFWVLLCSLAGLAVGSAASLPGRWMKFRARKGQGVLILLGALLALWCLYLWWSAWAILEQGAPWTWREPAAVWTQIQAHLAERATGGKVLAYVGYGLEALLLWNGVYSGLSNPLEVPFCTPCGRWTRAHEAVRLFRKPETSEGLAALTTDLGVGAFESLGSLGAPRAEDTQLLQVDLEICPACFETVYLTAFATSKTPAPAEEGLVEQIRSLRDLTSPSRWSRALGGGLLKSIEREPLVIRKAISPEDVETTLGFRSSL